MSPIKERLKSEFGTLRMASIKTGINYYKLSQICNGWLAPNKADQEKLKITQEEWDKVKKHVDYRLP